MIYQYKVILLTNKNKLLTYTICIKLEVIMLSVENSYIVYELINVSSRNSNKSIIRKNRLERRRRYWQLLASGGGRVSFL